MNDAIAVAQEVTPYITAAVGAYGAAVLTRAEEQAAEATVSFGQRVLRRLVRRGGTEQQAVTGAVTELAGAPDDADLQAALRLAIRRALLADPQLLAEIDALPRPVPPAGSVTITASGARSVAAHTIRGNVTTGDNHPPSGS